MSIHIRSIYTICTDSKVERHSLWKSLENYGIVKEASLRIITW